jgi:hypothetical protein
MILYSPPKPISFISLPDYLPLFVHIINLETVVVFGAEGNGEVGLMLGTTRLAVVSALSPLPRLAPRTVGRQGQGY